VGASDYLRPKALQTNPVLFVQLATAPTALPRSSCCCLFCSIWRGVPVSESSIQHVRGVSIAGSVAISFNLLPRQQLVQQPVCSGLALLLERPAALVTASLFQIHISGAFTPQHTYLAWQARLWPAWGIQGPSRWVLLLLQLCARCAVGWGGCCWTSLATCFECMLCVPVL
jgi:hypothetical protein